MPETHLHFIPSRVEGLADVSDVTVFSDRLEVCCAHGAITYRFSDIARWPKPWVFWKILFRLGVRPRYLPVADRDWFHDAPDMFFRFYTDPPLKIFMPLDESKERYSESYFFRTQAVIRQGGFHTNDLG